METIKELENGNMLVRVDFLFTKHGGRKKIIINGEEQNRDGRDTKVIKAIARAYRWQELLDTGKYSTAEEMAHVLGLDQSYVARTIRLTYLAPKIVQLFLEGKAPAGLSLATLVKKVPDSWTEQYELFGIPA